MIVNSCKNCGVDIHTYPSINRMCCSRKCNGEHKRAETYEKCKCICEQCGIEFLPKRPADGGRFCSYQCTGEFNRKNKVDRNGYWYVCLPDHPNCSSQGYVAEHRLIMEGMVGRYLTDDEIVHHKNENRKDNRIQNLEIMSDSEHKSHHIKESHAKGVLGSKEQRERASKRMKSNNPSKGKRGKDGKFIS